MIQPKPPFVHVCIQCVSQMTTPCGMGQLLNIISSYQAEILRGVNFSAQFQTFYVFFHRVAMHAGLPSNLLETYPRVRYEMRSAVNHDRAGPLLHWDTNIRAC